MPSDEHSATTDVVTLAKTADGLGESVARRLEDHGIETVADILIADEGALTDVPYVSDLRADTLREVASRIVDDEPAPEPRDIDLEATESVVSETAIPLSVRRGEAVLAKSAGKGSKDIYHTRACHVVRSCDGLIEREPRYVEDRDYEECQFCADPETVARNSMKSSQSDAPDPLVDPREVVLEATIGEKLNLTMADRDGYACAWAVIDVDEPTTWETPTGDTWQTRRIRISQKMNGEEHYSECDLVVAADEVRLEDPPVKRQSAQPNAPSWRLESVGAVGRVAPSTHAQLQGRLEDQDAKPEGDDSWRKYQRGEA